jgi:ubiquinone/menaquinone biosynthesis C-methylase UbiE
MSRLKAEQPDYGNWVPRRQVYTSGSMGFLSLALSLVSLILYTQKQAGLLSIILLIAFAAFAGVAAILIVGFVCFAYVHLRLSPKRGNIQARIEELVIGHLDWGGEGRALDIGCGNAPLSILIAKKFPTARVTGIDYWGANWEYSRTVCERNASIEGVASRVKFRRASASALPFKDGSFDAAVSNLVFHEVKDTSDKRDVIKEALRVLKKGGNFAFQDLFLRKSVYGEIDALLETVRTWGIKHVKFLDTSKSKFIKGPLRLSFMLGTIGILCGKK